MYHQKMFNVIVARRLGIVVISPARRTVDPGFEFRQRARFLCLYVYTLQCRSRNFKCIVYFKKPVLCTRCKSGWPGANTTTTTVVTTPALCKFTTHYFHSTSYVSILRRQFGRFFTNSSGQLVIWSVFLNNVNKIITIYIGYCTDFETL
jgi:hypothetical protein